ncbi:MAG: PorP/SprF family type IX secretion system membrane protein [Chitinophagaceae bacterium]|nr:PorP/SprF family type IX secretion system membrane protein [Chitinophagaceae bacterium]
MKPHCVVVMLGILFAGTLRAQDLHFSQFYEAPLVRNPALAGLFEGDIRAQMVYRNQWGSVTTPYQTGSLNGEYKLPIGKGDDFVTAGLQVLWDRAGTVSLTTTHLLPAVNYHKSLSADKNRYISLGFMGGLVSRRLDRSKVTTNNQYDGFGYNGSLPDGETFANNYSYFDAGVGMSYNSSIGDNKNNNYFVGIAYHHFNKPVNAFYQRLQHLPKWVASGGLRTTMGEMAYITFHGDISVQGPFKEYIAGVMYSRKLGDMEVPDYTLHFGGYLRWGDAIIPVVKLDYNPFSLGFSYDMNVSQLRTASQGRGGFEISLSYTGFLDSRNSTKDIVRCPRF